jgi:DNA-binding SARP family transcriptional activator/ABC-type branched-subunit amino acid transport system substrate-binding protein/DNA-binding beta-propeller fold protein YncE
MRVRILGALEIWEGSNQLPLGTGRQRALLALLLVHAGQVVSADRLVDELWEGEAPQTALKVLQGYVSQLRRVLGADTIVTQGSGYALKIVETDAREFERLVDDARRAEPRDAARMLRDALALWRGPPLVDVAYDSWAQPEISRLEELRLVALEDRIDADLRLGTNGGLVPELEGLVAEHPLRERLCAQLMLARYRAGRQAAALEAYGDARRRLVDELGIEPGPELQDLHRRILVHDEELGPVTRPPRPLAAAAHRAPLFVAVGVLLLASAAAAAGFLLTGNGAGGVRPNSLVLLRSGSGAIAAQVGVGSRPSQIAVGAGAVWVLNSDDNTVTEVDPATRKAVVTFGVGPRPVALAAGSGALWLESGPASTGSQGEGSMLPATLTRLDPTTRTATQSVHLPTAFVATAYGRLPGQRLIVVGAGSVWTVGGDYRLLRLDARSGRLLRRYPFTADSLAFGAGRLWIVEEGHQVLRLDPRTNRVDLTYPLAAGPGVAVGFGSAWVADPVQGLVWRLYPGPRRRLRSIPVGQGAFAVAVGGGAVWSSNTILDEAIRIDARTNRPDGTVPLTAPQDLATGPNGVWVTTGPAPPASGPLPATICGPLLYPRPGSPQFIVASDLALRGPAGESTRPIRQGIETLIREHGFRAGKYTIGYQSCDDSTVQSGSFDLAKCVTNARAYSSDLDVIGIVGTYNSGCAQIEIPILNRAPKGPLAMVSPLNTVGGLTVRSVANLPGLDLYPTGVRNYARVIAADQIQYAADAVLERSLGVRQVAVLDDGSPYAIQADRWFSFAARRLGVRAVTVRLHGAPGAVVARVRASHASGVFLAGPGDPPFVVRLRKGLRRDVPIVVTDWIGVAGLRPSHGSDGIYVSDPGMPDSALPPAGGRFVRRVGSLLSFTAAYGGGAAELLLAAIASSDGTRASVARALIGAHIRHGILGDLRIDANGDPTTAAVTIFRMRAHARNDTGEVDNQGAIVDRVITPPARVVPR